MSLAHKLEPISEQAFSSYGKVLMPTGDGQRKDHFDLIVNTRPDAKTNLVRVRAARPADQQTLTITLMERHPYSSQTFFPMDVGAYLVAVCPDDARGQPDVSRLRAFVVPGHLGIHYYPGTWHTGITVLTGQGEFLVLMHENGSAEDCVFSKVDPTTILLTTSSDGFPSALDQQGDQPRL